MILLKSIEEAKKINDNIYTKQEEVDSATYNLYRAIDKFNNSKIEKQQFTKAMAVKYVVNKYGKAPEGYEYSAENSGIENGLRYWKVMFGPDRGGLGVYALDAYTVYENGQIIKWDMSEDEIY